jgi:mannose-6-phosphate isomerase-like protein (cupin superfamily)
MKRRTLLASAAGLFPATLLESFALGQDVSSDVHARVVPAGEDHDREVHSRGYSSMLFKVLPGETNGGLFILEHSNLIKGGPPLHLHLAQEEWFYVMAGEVVFQVGDKRLHLHAGDSVLAPRKVPHTFAAVGEKPGKLLIAFNPAGKMEEFLRITAVPNPPVQDAAFFRRYDMELIGPSPLQA